MINFMCSIIRELIYKSYFSKEGDVMSKLAGYSEDIIRRTGFFQSHRKLVSKIDEIYDKEVFLF